MDSRLLAIAEKGDGFTGAGTCACGTRQFAAKMYHQYIRFHECTYHPRHLCPWCKAVDCMVKAIEARLAAELKYGPFS